MPNVLVMIELSNNILLPAIANFPKAGVRQKKYSIFTESVLKSQ